MRPRMLVWTVAICGVLVACTSDGRDLDAAAIPIEVTDADIELPVDAYRLLPSEFAVYQNALDRALVACMEREGFDFQLLPRPTSPTRPAHNRRYGLNDATHAQRYGYHPIPLSHDEAAALQNRVDLERSLSNAAVLAVTGGHPIVDVDDPTPTEGAGCYGEAIAFVSAEDLQRNTRFVDRLKDDSWVRSKADSRVTDAFDEWSSCMADAGFRYGDPFGANDDAQWASGDLPDGQIVEDILPLVPGDPQIATATRDVECNRQANVAGIWMAVETAYQLELIEQHQEELARIKADLNELLFSLGLSRG